MNKGLTGFIYLLWLLWLFVGISIVSDIFMESIEAITSQTQIIVVKDPETGEE
jgi:solute carrier family 8 (sodium/calcium exchanger)